MTGSAIEARDLAKVFPGDVLAVNGFSAQTVSRGSALVAVILGCILTAAITLGGWMLSRLVGKSPGKSFCRPDVGLVSVGRDVPRAPRTDPGNVHGRLIRRRSPS